MTASLRLQRQPAVVYVVPSAAAGLSIRLHMQIATFMFTGRREWKFSGDPPVAASLMMMPVVFAMLMLVNAVVLLCIWVASQWWTDRTQQAYLQLPQVRQACSTEESAGAIFKPTLPCSSLPP